MTVESKCKRCGVATQYPFPSKVRDYCSHACSNAEKWNRRARGETAALKCAHCDDSFTLLLSKLRAREAGGAEVKYCSVSCSAAASIKPESKRSRYRTRNPRVYPAGPWSVKHPDVEARRAYFRAYSVANRDHLNRLAREWAKANRAYRNYLQQQRRAAGALTYSQWLTLIQTAGACAHCGSTDKLEVDHLIPVAKGGKTEDGNLQILCRSCNASKGTSESPRRPGLKHLTGLDVRVTK